jgi:hypothetical protein
VSGTGERGSTVSRFGYVKIALPWGSGYSSRVWSRDQFHRPLTCINAHAGIERARRLVRGRVAARDVADISCCDPCTIVGVVLKRRTW